MKIRTDFVTNSSSSSFLFQELDRKKIVKMDRQKTPAPFQDRYILQYGISHIDVDRFRAYDMNDLYEVFEWYRTDLIYNILGQETGKTKPLQSREQDDHISAVLMERKDRFSQEEMKRLTAYFIITFLDYFFRWNALWEQRQTTNVFSYDFLKENHWSFIMEGWDYDIYDFYTEKMEQMLELSKEFDGQHLGDIMEYLFDVKYLYFNDVECPYELYRVIRESDQCKYACNHMG